MIGLNEKKEAANLFALEKEICGLGDKLLLPEEQQEKRFLQALGQLGTGEGEARAMAGFAEYAAAWAVLEAVAGYQDLRYSGLYCVDFMECEGRQLLTDRLAAVIGEQETDGQGLEEAYELLMPEEDVSGCEREEARRAWRRLERLSDMESLMLLMIRAQDRLAFIGEKSLEDQPDQACADRAKALGGRIGRMLDAGQVKRCMEKREKHDPRAARLDCFDNQVFYIERVARAKEKKLLAGIRIAVPKALFAAPKMNVEAALLTVLMYLRLRADGGYSDDFVMTPGQNASALGIYADPGERADRLYDRAKTAQAKAGENFPIQAFVSVGQVPMLRLSRSIWDAFEAAEKAHAAELYGAAQAEPENGPALSGGPFGSPEEALNALMEHTLSRACGRRSMKPMAPDMEFDDCYILHDDGGRSVYRQLKYIFDEQSKRQMREAAREKTPMKAPEGGAVLQLLRMDGTRPDSPEACAEVLSRLEWIMLGELTASVKGGKAVLKFTDNDVSLPAGNKNLAGSALRLMLAFACWRQGGGDVDGCVEIEPDPEGERLPGALEEALRALAEEEGWADFGAFKQAAAARGMKLAFGAVKDAPDRVMVRLDGRLDVPDALEKWLESAGEGCANGLADAVMTCAGHMMDGRRGELKAIKINGRARMKLTRAAHTENLFVLTMAYMAFCARDGFGDKQQVYLWREDSARGFDVKLALGDKTMICRPARLLSEEAALAEREPEAFAAFLKEAAKGDMQFMLEQQSGKKQDSARALMAKGGVHPAEGAEIYRVYLPNSQ